MQSIKFVKDSVLNGATKALTTGDSVFGGVCVGCLYALWIGRVVSVNIGWVTASAVAASSYLVFSFSYNVSAELLNSTQLSERVKLYLPYLVGGIAVGGYCWMLAVPTITALSLSALGMFCTTVKNVAALKHINGDDWKETFMQDVAKNKTRAPKKRERAFIYVVRAALGGLALETLLKVSNWYLGTAMLGWSTAFTFGAMNAAILFGSFIAAKWVVSKTVDHGAVKVFVVLLIHGVYFYSSPFSLISNIALTTFGFASYVVIKELCGK